MRVLMQWVLQTTLDFQARNHSWVNPNYVKINEEALANPDSIFYTYQKLVQIRKENSWLVRADFELLETAEKVFAFIQRTGTPFP